MRPANHGKEPSRLQPGSLETGAQLHAWRVAQGLTAKRVGQLIELTERSIHRAERGGRLGARIRMGMKLLETRIASGEVVLSPEKRVVERIRRTRDSSLVVKEPGAKYGQWWHGQLRSGADIRAWRKSTGLYVKELAELLGVTSPSLIRAEQSQSPSLRIVYGVELLRNKVLSGDVDLRRITEARVKRGGRKKVK
jgi:transcriptional regulator with XRE-family HTH domain